MIDTLNGVADLAQALPDHHAFVAAAKHLLVGQDEDWTRKEEDEWGDWAGDEEKIIEDEINGRDTLPEFLEDEEKEFNNGIGTLEKDFSEDIPDYSEI